MMQTLHFAVACHASFSPIGLETAPRWTTLQRRDVRWGICNFVEANMPSIRYESVLVAALTAITVLAIPGCTEQSPTASEPDVNVVNRLDGPGLEDPDWIQFETTLSGSGGLPGWTNANESHSRTLTVTFDWSYQHEEWDVSNLLDDNEDLFSGFAQSAAVDVAKTVKEFDSHTITNRLGASVTVPTSQPPLDLFAGGASAILSALTSTRLTGASARRTHLPQFTSAERRAIKTSRLRPSTRSAQKAEARLRSQFGTGIRTGDGQMEFRKRVGEREVRTLFDAQIGAVTRIVRFEGGQRRAETTRHYVKAGDHWQLDSIVTQRFDSTGIPTHRLVQQIRNVRVGFNGHGARTP